MKLLSSKSCAEISRYGLASILSVLLALLLPVFFVKGFGIEPSWSVVSSLMVLYIVNFITMDNFVYRRAGSRARKILSYLGVSALFRISEYLIFEFIYRVFDVYYLAAFIIAIGLSFLIKYSVYKHVVFAFEIGEESHGSK